MEKKKQILESISMGGTPALLSYDISMDEVKEAISSGILYCKTIKDLRNFIDFAKHLIDIRTVEKSKDTDSDSTAYDLFIAIQNGENLRDIKFPTKLKKFEYDHAIRLIRPKYNYDTLKELDDFIDQLTVIYLESSK